MARFTPDQYQAYLARTSPAAAVANLTALTPCDSEADLHEDIRQECARRGWMFFHGSMAHRTYRTKGENDFHCLLPGGVVLFIECKTATGKLSTEQLGTAAWMRKLGHEMHVVRSIAEFKLLCDEALKSVKQSQGSRCYATKVE